MILVRKSTIILHKSKIIQLKIYSKITSLAEMQRRKEEYLAPLRLSEQNIKTWNYYALLQNQDVQKIIAYFTDTHFIRIAF